MGLPVRSLAYGVHLFGRGGPPAGLPCGSQIPTYSSFSVRPFSARGGTSFTMCRPAVRARGHAGGGGGLLLVPPHFCWGGGDRGSKKSAPQFPGPQGEPAHGLHPRFVVAEIWADRGLKGGGGLAGTPILPGSPYGPRRRRAGTFEASILLAPKAPEQNFGCQRQTSEGEGGPPTVHGQSNTSLAPWWWRHSRPLNLLCHITLLGGGGAEGNKSASGCQSLWWHKVEHNFGSATPVAQ